MLGVVALVMEPTSPRLHEQKNASRVGNSYSNLRRKHHHIISHQSKGAITKPIWQYSKCMQMFRALKPCSNFFFTSGSLLPKSFCLAVVPQGAHPVKLQSGGCHGATAATWVNGTAKSMEKSCDTSITAKTFPLCAILKNTDNLQPHYPGIVQYYLSFSPEIHENSLLPNESKPSMNFPPLPSPSRIPEVLL